MNHTKVSHCANPKCGAEFKRLGEGKLFVRPVNPTANGLHQKAIWLCDSCAQKYDMAFDKSHHSFKLVPLARIA